MADRETKVTERTWIPLGMAVAVGLGLFSGGWAVKGAVNSMERAITGIDQRVAAVDARVAAVEQVIAAAKVETWTVTDMERFGYLLERNNRQLPLWVPDSRDVKRVSGSTPTPPRS